MLQIVSANILALVSSILLAEEEDSRLGALDWFESIDISTKNHEVTCIEKVRKITIEVNLLQNTLTH